MGPVTQHAAGSVRRARSSDGRLRRIQHPLSQPASFIPQPTVRGAYAHLGCERITVLRREPASWRRVVDQARALLQQRMSWCGNAARRAGHSACSSQETVCAAVLVGAAASGRRDGPRQRGIGAACTPYNNAAFIPRPTVRGAYAHLGCERITVLRREPARASLRPCGLIESTLVPVQRALWVCGAERV